ncbi:MAG TPA: phosphatidate cytidylyltransferase [Aestuariivirgaceae bacterium]|nr:phosphatidate cytidylyltransferase [Aestuariivirgaceae bacterium]
MMGNSSVTATDPSKWRDLGVRVVAAAILIPLVVLVVWLGSYWFEAIVTLLALLMAREWVKLALRGDNIQLALHLAAALVAPLLATRIEPSIGLAIVAGLWAASIVRQQLQGREHSLWSIVGVPYVALPAMAFVLLRASDQFGFIAVSWVLVVVWSADTAAYFAGRIFGGPRLWPRISPKKTWAGMAGAIVGGALASLLAAAFFGVHAPIPMLVVGGALGAIEQGGDLFESALKRHAGVKDSSRLIPGHGGMLDRVDGLVAAVFCAVLLGIAREGLHDPARGLFVW